MTPTPSPPGAPPSWRRQRLRLALALLPLLLAGGAARAAVAEPPAPLSVAEAEAFMLESSLSVIAARAGVDMVRAQAVIAAYWPNPTLSLAAEQFDVRNPRLHAGSDSGEAANRTYTVHVDQPFETGGKRDRRIENAEQLRQAAEAQVLDAARQARFAVEQAFYGVLLARENLGVAEENIRLADTTEKLIRDQVDAGNKSASDLISFQVSRVQYAQDLAAAELARDQSMVDLANALGLEPERLARRADGSARELSGSLAFVPPDVAHERLAGSAAERADVRAAERAMAAAASALELARAQRSIDVTVGVEYQRVGSDNTVGLTASLPLPAWNDHQGEIGAAEAQLRQARAQLTLALRQAQADQEKAWQGYQSSRKLLAIYSDDTLAKARRALDIAKSSYQQGATGLLDLVDAQRTYNQLRVAANQALLSCRLGLAQLSQATGIDLPQP
jgi:cobalt-zinc-cadmium efflux system outer membrane protein